MKDGWDRNSGLDELLRFLDHALREGADESDVDPRFVLIDDLIGFMNYLPASPDEMEPVVRKMRTWLFANDEDAGKTSVREKVRQHLESSDRSRYNSWFGMPDILDIVLYGENEAYAEYPIGRYVEALFDRVGEMILGDADEEDASPMRRFGGTEIDHPVRRFDGTGIDSPMRGSGGTEFAQSMRKSGGTEIARRRKFESYMGRLKQYIIENSPMPVLTEPVTAGEKKDAPAAEAADDTRDGDLRSGQAAEAPQNRQAAEAPQNRPAAETPQNGSDSAAEVTFLPEEANPWNNPQRVEAYILQRWTGYPDIDGRIYRIAGISFVPGGKVYDYLCDDPGVRQGDHVIVKGYGSEEEVEVVSVMYKIQNELSLPLERYKRVIRRVT